MSNPTEKPNPKKRHWQRLKAINENKPLGTFIDIFRVYVPLALILIGFLASMD